MDAVIIVNPVSGTTPQEEKIKTVRSAAKELGWKGELHETTLKTSALKIAQKAIKEGAKHIVVCGGDGTVMEVITAAMGTPVKIGVVPFGTGNLFAQNLNLSLDVKESLKTALSGKEQLIDVGKANDTYFSIMAGMGMDTDMLKGADRDLKKKFGIGAYILSILKSFYKPPRTYNVTIDNNVKKRIRARSILVANMGKIHGGIELVPHAHPQNGTLQIGVIRARRILSWLNLVFNALAGKIHKSPHYTLLQGKYVEIESLKGPQSYECDGNVFPPCRTLFITIYPSSVHVLVNDIK
jgi:YegS/Rv2252/BmrU family lipid kinase